MVGNSGAAMTQRVWPCGMETVAPRPIPGA